MDHKFVLWNFYITVQCTKYSLRFDRNLLPELSTAFLSHLMQDILLSHSRQFDRTSEHKTQVEFFIVCIKDRHFMQVNSSLQVAQF
jgi:hypothetical protein